MNLPTTESTIFEAFFFLLYMNQAVIPALPATKAIICIIGAVVVAAEEPGASVASVPSVVDWSDTDRPGWMALA